MNYRMEIAYDGTRYNGWQKLGDTPNTIQEKIESVLSAYAGMPVDVHGAGRTDAGVHAACQTAQFRIEDIPEKTLSAAGRSASVSDCSDDIREYLNRYLPDDIGILSVSEAAPRFHSRYHAKGKIYTYRMTADMSRHVFDRRYITRLVPPASWTGAADSIGSENRTFSADGLRTLLPDVDAMKKAAAALVGTHDFKSFCGNSHFKKSTVRTIFSVDIETDGPDITITYCGEGFLQYMVRIMTGTLLEIGYHERPSDSISAILDAKNRRAAGKTAPPEGLTLTRVIY